MSDFKSFCTRMWLDYCDENKDFIAAQARMDRDEYVKTYHNWLKERHKKQNES